jgi:hypothetical protein
MAFRALKLPPLARKPVLALPEDNGSFCRMRSPCGTFCFDRLRRLFRRAYRES